MGKFYAFLIAIIFFSCSSKKDTGNETADSLQHSADTTLDVNDTIFVSASSLEELNPVFEKLRNSLNENEKGYYRLRLNSKGYDYHTDVTWHFDTLFNLVHTLENWSSEGVEGTSEYFYNMEKLYALENKTRQEDETDVYIFHREVGGLSYRSNANNLVKGTEASLDRAVVTETEQTSRKQLGDVIRILRSNQDMVRGREPKVLVIENNAGKTKEKEKTEISVDGKLMNKLLN